MRHSVFDFPNLVCVLCAYQVSSRLSTISAKLFCMYRILNIYTGLLFKGVFEHVFVSRKQTLS